MKTDPTLRRLRAANPFPATADGAANEELFARITAQRPQARGTRRRYRRALVIVAVALVAVAVLASTAFAISQWLSGDVVKPPVTKAEYREAQSALTVPAGFKWPVLHVDRNSVTTRGGGGSYAVFIAQNAWECAWVKAIRQGDAPAQAQAQAQLNDLLRNRVIVAPLGAPEDWVPADSPTFPYAVFAHDGGYEWKQQTYALAAAGNPTRLAQSCRANAPG
jgi:hypothetical protein